MPRLGMFPDRLYDIRVMTVSVVRLTRRSRRPKYAPSHRSRQMASDAPARIGSPQAGRLRGTARHGVRTAGTGTYSPPLPPAYRSNSPGSAAARGPVPPAAPAPRRAARACRDAAARRSAPRSALLDDAAEVHHQRALAHVADQRQVVADVDRGEAQARRAPRAAGSGCRRAPTRPASTPARRRRSAAARAAARAPAPRAATARRRARAAGGPATRPAGAGARGCIDRVDARRMFLGAGMPKLRSGSASERRIVKRGLSASNGFWNTSCARARKAQQGRAVAARDVARPGSGCGRRVGSSSRSSRRAVVVLPQPDSPTMPSASPAARRG